MFEPLHVRAYKGLPVRPLDDVDLDVSYRPPTAWQEDVTTSRLDFAWVWRAVTQRWKLIAATVLIFLAPSIVYVQLAEPVYRSTAVIQIFANGSQVLPYDDPLEPMNGGVTDYELTMKTYDGILKSHALRERVMERFRSAPDATVNVEEALRADPIVERVEGSQLVSLSYLAADPSFAAEAANSWVEELIGMEADGQIAKAEQATGFLRSQLAALKVQVEQAEANLIAYARQHRILDLDSDSESVVRKRLTQLTEELTRAEANLVAQQARHGSLTRASQAGVPASLNKPVIAELEARVFETEQALIQLKAEFGDKWPAVVQKERELTLVKDQLDRAQSGAVQELTLDSEFQLTAALREYETLKVSAETQAALVSSLNEDLVAYNALNRDFQTTNELYQSLLQRLKETAVVAGLERRRVHLMDPAVPGSEPYRPRKALTLLLALTSALGLGTALSLVLQTAGDTFSSPEEVERLGVPVLGALPRVRRSSADEFLANHAVNMKLLEPAASNGQPVSGRYTLDEQQLLRESYRSVCSSLILSRPEGPPKKILISSALPREGKTTSASAIGATLAELGAKTILVDADLRNPCLSRSFGRVQGQGLSTFLSGGSVNVVPTGHNNLFLLPSGPPAPNPMALFSSARMSELLHELSKQFEFVVLDSPPILGLADSVVLASQVDGVVLVTKAGKTSRSMLRQTVAQLKRTGAVVLGAAVTQIEDRTLGNYTRYYASPGDPTAEDAASPLHTASGD